MFLLEARRLMTEADRTPLRHEGNQMIVATEKPNQRRTHSKGRRFSHQWWQSGLPRAGTNSAFFQLLAAHLKTTMTHNLFTLYAWSAMPETQSGSLDFGGKRILLDIKRHTLSMKTVYTFFSLVGEKLNWRIWQKDPQCKVEHLRIDSYGTDKIHF